MEQVDWAFSKCNDMAPSRLLFSPKVVFKQLNKLEEAFVQANESIVKNVKKVVPMFGGNKMIVLDYDCNKASRYVRNVDSEVEEGVRPNIDGSNCEYEIHFTLRMIDKK